MARSFRSLLLSFSVLFPLVAQENIAAYPIAPTGVVPIAVYDAQGHPVGRILPQKRYWVPLERIPLFLQKALLAVEDSHFYEHGGVDVRGIARALVKNAVKGRWAEGGSTITQQLIKNKFLSPEKSLDRKVKEARMAMDFEEKYTKAQILEMYFNEISFGNGTMGIQQAARLYFNKSSEELTTAECLLLAGVPKSPSHYNPWGQTKDVAMRRDIILNRMVELKLISPQQREGFWANPATIQGRGQAPQYLAYIKTQLVERFGPDILERGGLDVTAAVDLNLQKQAEQILREGVHRIHPELQGALVCMDPANGDILAAVGDVEGLPSSINRAFASRRQPGSSIKPLIYASALEKGITAASLWSDTPASYDRGNGKLWTPQNYGKEHFGQLSLRQALAHSGNVVTVKVLDTVGVPSFVATAARMGLSLRPQGGLSLALGTDEVTLKELVQAYTPLASGGTLAQGRAILGIHDRAHSVMTENPPSLTPALSPETAFITTQMLKDVLVYGTAKSLKPFSKAYPSAGKTGTTDSAQDAWFIGYTPHLITGVWVGYDRPRPGGRGFTGGTIAAPIWERFMSKAMASRPADDFPKPESILCVAVDPASGLLATEACPTPLQEYFAPGTQPTEVCPLHAAPPVQAEQP